MHGSTVYAMDTRRVSIYLGPERMTRRVSIYLGHERIMYIFDVYLLDLDT